MSQENEESITIMLVHGIPTLWNESDCEHARAHRILGTLVGPLPKFYHEKVQFGLPLRLMNVEAKLLIDKGLADVFDFTSEDAVAGDVLKMMFLEREKMLNEEQNMIAFEQRKEEVVRMAERILEGKRKKMRKSAGVSSTQTGSGINCSQSVNTDIKSSDNSSTPIIDHETTPSVSLNVNMQNKSMVNHSPIANTENIPTSSPSTREKEQLTVEHIIKSEISKITKKESKFIEISMEHPFLSELPLKQSTFEFPKTKDEQLRYAVYKDLWEKGFHISCGVKFGGDFLAYHGDPDSYHATFIVKCLDEEEELDSCDIVAWVRVGTVTKKTVVLATIDYCGVVQYQSFQWAGEDLAEEDESLHHL